MENKIKDSFFSNWKKYFGEAELPVTFYYGDQDGGAERVPPAKGQRCLIGDLAKVRQGQSLCYDADAVACGGGKRYLGFTNTMRPDFDYFLSCGIPGKMEGERYKRTPEMVREIMKNYTPLPITGKYIIFKRWDKLEESDNPDAVIFFAKPDVLSGLFTLANFDQTASDGVITPFGAGCGSIVYYPFMEKFAPSPRAVIGMFDVSARPFVPADTLTFAAPMTKFMKMIGYMDESFLITESWDKVRKRIVP